MPENSEDSKSTNMLTNIKIDLKTLIAIVLWVSSLIGMYYTMKSDIDDLKGKYSKQEEILEKNNLVVLVTKFETMEKKVDKVESKLDKVIDKIDEDRERGF